jgi:hypothetical protein
MQEKQGEVSGVDNRIAGRDYYENPVFVSAPIVSTRPGLLHCPACDRAGLAPTALICPDCGHDFTHAWRAAQRRSNGRRNAALLTLTAAVVTGGNVYVNAPRLMGDWVVYVLLTVWLCVGVAWGQYYWLHVRPE